MPRNNFECRATRLHYQGYHRQLVGELALSCPQLALVLSQGTRAKPPLISLGTSRLTTLNQDIIDITAKVVGQGLIVIELGGRKSFRNESIYSD
jgi:hypothetical protein